MGAGANSSGNKALNDKAERAAGRQKDRGPTREAIRDAGGIEPGKGPVDGAFGEDGQANRKQGNVTGEGGGGGGASAASDLADVNASTKPTKKRS